MLALEDVLSELAGEEAKIERGLPPGFRFHPTDEELVTFYLASKVFNGGFCTLDIAEVDLNRCEPWELPEIARMGEREWYFFSVRDRKYPTGLRTNRATVAGYWKATGKDREVYGDGGALVGMKKTLVFYKGRAPRGIKSRWVMHEYRLDGRLSLRGHSRKEEWVICRVYHKAGEKKSNGIQQGQICNFQHQQPILEPPCSFAEEHKLKKTLIDPTVYSHTNNIFCKPDQSGYVSTVENPNPLFHLADYELLGLPAAADQEDGVMSAALDKSDFHMMLDSSIRFPPDESWPFML